MSSETPKDGIPASSTGAAHQSGTHGHGKDHDTPGALGLENLEPSIGDDFDNSDIGHGIGTDSDSESVNFLTVGERKLSLGEQRQILAGRRRIDDDSDTEEVLELRTGRRHMREKLNEQVRASLKPGGAKADEQQPGGGTGGTAPGGSSAIVVESTTPPAATVASNPGATPGETTLLNDPAHPNKPLFDAVLKGVGDLDPALVALTPAEQANVAAALTASMTQTHGFPREQTDAVQVSVAASDKGDRVFAINGQSPDAPNAVYTSVAVEQARAQPLDVSTAQAIAPQQQELQQTKPVQEQSTPIETPAPRAIV